MQCPQCGYQQYCPCETCFKYLPHSMNPWNWIDGEAIEGAGCGFTQHADFWLDEEANQLKAAGHWKDQ